MYSQSMQSLKVFVLLYIIYYTREHLNGCVIKPRFTMQNYIRKDLLPNNCVGYTQTTVVLK